MNPHDRCQGCDTMRKEHASQLSSCVRFIEPGECCCLFAEEIGRHLHQRCPFNAAYSAKLRQLGTEADRLIRKNAESGSKYFKS